MILPRSPLCATCFGHATRRFDFIVTDQPHTVHTCDEHVAGVHSLLVRTDVWAYQVTQVVSAPSLVRS